MKRVFLFCILIFSLNFSFAQDIGLNGRPISTGKQSVLQFFINDLNSRRLVTDALIEEYVLYGERYFLIWGDDRCGYGSLDVRPLLIKPLTLNSYRQAAHFYLSDVRTEYDDMVEVEFGKNGCFPWVERVSFFKETKRIRIVWAKPLQKGFPINNLGKDY